MGTYCDRCFTMGGSISTSDFRSFDVYDVCKKCNSELHSLVVNDVHKHKKYNQIGSK